MTERPSTQEVYDRSALRYHERFRSYQPYREQVVDFLADIPPGGRIVDLGCGAGANARLIGEAGFQVVGYDFSEAMLELARRECPDGDFIRCDLRKLPETEPFEAALASFCIVHFTDDEAVSFLHQLPRLLVPGGALYLSFMEGRQAGVEKPSFSSSPLFYNYFDRTWITQVLTAAGLLWRSTVTSVYPEADGTTTTDVFLRFGRPGCLAAAAPDPRGR